ncbi:hypothetical protein [Streptomyces sp. NRRL S-455]|uniref:hypothetical protein n=1 Tax=Streptomyces sp. NRRL S-455 TaxID=1463908 RepID=UPI000A66B269|nr:hypothetical protein [Streptomyces sp. NRRL S-455]
MKNYLTKYLILGPNGERCTGQRVVRAKGPVDAHESVRADLVTANPAPAKVLVMRVHAL